MAFSMWWHTESVRTLTCLSRSSPSSRSTPNQTRSRWASGWRPSLKKAILAQMSSARSLCHPIRPRLGFSQVAQAAPSTSPTMVALCGDSNDSKATQRVYWPQMCSLFPQLNASNGREPPSAWTSKYPLSLAPVSGCATFGFKKKVATSPLSGSDMLVRPAITNTGSEVWLKSEIF